MAMYRKKPVEIEVRGPLTTKNSAELAAWSGGIERPAEGSLFMPTLEGLMVANLGDYIIRGVQGEFYPCKPDIFAATYDAV